MAVVAYGIDFSSARFDGAWLANNAVVVDNGINHQIDFVCRYLRNYGTLNKALTRAEADNLRAAGLQLVSNDETTGTRYKSGYSGGRQDAAAADAAHLAAGGPPGAPIYFTPNDHDPALWSDADWKLLWDYLDGAASKLGRGRVGLYYNYEALRRAFDLQKITWGWQCYAWSHGRWEPRAHIQQYLNAQWSDQVDFDRAIKADYGQWGATQEVDMTDAQAAQLKFIYDVLNDQLGDGTPVDHETKLYRLLAWGTETKGPGRPNLTDLSAAIVDLKAAVDALTAGVPVTLTDAQLESIKASLQTLEGSAMVQLAVSPSVP